MALFSPCKLSLGKFIHFCGINDLLNDNLPQVYCCLPDTLSPFLPPLPLPGFSPVFQQPIRHFQLHVLWEFPFRYVQNKTNVLPSKLFHFSLSLLVNSVYINTWEKLISLLFLPFHMNHSPNASETCNLDSSLSITFFTSPIQVAFQDSIIFHLFYCTNFQTGFLIQPGVALSSLPKWPFWNTNLIMPIP